MLKRLNSPFRNETSSCLHAQAFFRNKNPISACERRLKTMEQLCQKLPENDPIQKALLEARDAVSKVKGEVESAHVRLQEHPDKWCEWHRRWGPDREKGHPALGYDGDLVLRSVCVCVSVLCQVRWTLSLDHVPAERRREPRCAGETGTRFYSNSSYCRCSKYTDSKMCWYGGNLCNVYGRSLVSGLCNCFYLFIIYFLSFFIYLFLSN